MTNRDREISFIPGGLTRFFHPLNVVINKPFKSAMKEKYIITSKMVYNSFRYKGIENALNHSEDNLFNRRQRMKDEKSLIDNDLENDFDFNDNLAD